MLSRSLVFILALSASALAAAQDPNHIRLLASNCANCHGTDGHTQGGMPGLSGMAKPLFVQHMQDFKSGKRPATIMHQLAKGYTDAEIEGLAAYFSSQKN